MTTMRRNKTKIPPKTPNETHNHHCFSPVLKCDHRVDIAPRHVGTVHKSASAIYIVKIYALLETPGSELMTISRINPKTQEECEFRFDERFAVSLRFRKQTDEERVAYAKEQIERVGGFKELDTVFASIFSEI